MAGYWVFGMLCALPLTRTKRAPAGLKMLPSIYEELFSLRGKTALVTGGAKGIGAMLSHTLVQAGCHVVIVARSAETGKRWVSQLAQYGSCAFVQHDLASAEGIETLLPKLEGCTERLDILVNNAGTFNAQPLGAVMAAQWDDLLGLNLKIPFILTQALLPYLEAAGTAHNPSRVVNIGSIGGLMPQSNGAYAYGCSKAALHQLTRMLASDLGSRHINVNAIAPGFFPSDMTAGFFEAFPGLEQNILENIPAGRFGTPQDIGGLLIFLCSRAGAYLNGSVTALDGGYLGR